MKPWIILAALLLVPAAGPADGKEWGLLYTTRFNQESAQFAPGSALNEVRDDEIQYVVPQVTNPPFDYTSKQFATHLGFNVLLGDFDTDDNYFENYIFYRLDALMRPRDEDGNPVELTNMRQLFISPRYGMESDIAAPSEYTNALRPSDVGRIVPDGHFELFLSDEQVRDAFGIEEDVQDLNLDAIAYDPFDEMVGNDQVEGGIYLSFENMNGLDICIINPYTGKPMTYTILDGAVLRIPKSDITWTTSEYDGVTQLVDSVNPNCGQIIAVESEMTLKVQNSGVCDNMGNPVPSVIDVDGLTFKKNPGIFYSQHIDEWVHDFWFCYYRENGGAGILTTFNNGRIALLNGVLMGNNDAGPPVRTTGEQVGLDPSTVPVHSLAGLALTEADVPHFVTDSTTPTGGAVIEVEIGGATEAGLAILSWGQGPINPGEVDPGISIESVGSYAAFPEFYPPEFESFPWSAFSWLWPFWKDVVVIDASDCGGWSCPIPAGAFVLYNCTFQMVLPLDEPYWVSAPMVIQF